MASRDEMVNLRGLHSNPNQFLTPNGAARYAKNVWFTRPGLASKRRGFTRHSTTLTYGVRKLMAYRDLLLAHTSGAGHLYRIDRTSGAIVQVATGIAAPSSSTGTRVRGCTSGNNFYLATSDAPKRISSTSECLTAGGLVAPGFDNQGVASPLSGTGGFLTDGNSCAYRYELVHLDAFGREIVGPVSGRLIVSNINGVGGWSTTVAKNYTVRALLPPDATQHDIIRFYRSGQKTAGQALDDDLKLVFEAQLKQGDVTNGYYELTDITPDALRGAFIYTSPNAGEGITQNNELPPACLDLAHHKGRVWYAGTTQRATFELQILAVGGTSGIQNNDTLVINGVTFTAKTAAPGTNEYLIVTSGTASYNIEQTALNLISAINKTASTTLVWARYLSGPDDVPGKILFVARTVGLYPASLSVGAGSKRDCWNPSMLPGQHVVNLTRSGGTTVRASVTSGTQSFKVGEQVVIGPGGAGSGGSTFGTGPFTVTAIDGAGAWFEYTENGTNGTLNAQAAVLFADEISGFTQEVKLNRIYYSKFLEPDSVPWVNWIDVGAEDKEIVAVVAQGETLQVWKEDGIYRIVGTDEVSFEAIEIDVNVRALCREMVVPFQGRVAGLTDKGVLFVSETGDVDDLDFPIRNDVLAQITQQGANLVELCFMVAYEAEDMLMVFWSGNKDLVDGSNTACNLGYVFNGQAGEWSQWYFDFDDGLGNGKTCGLMHPTDRVLYFGDHYLTTSSATYVYKERKSRSSADYRDTRGDNSNAAIKWQYSPVIQTGHAAGLDKQFNEVGLLFNGTQPATLTVDDENEFGNGSSHTVVRNAAQYGNRIWPGATNGRWLGLTVTHDTIDEGVDLAGVHVEYEVLNTAVQK